MSALCVVNTSSRAKDWGDIYGYIRSVHKKGSFSCNSCNKKFSSKDYLRDNAKTHIEVDFECDHCQEIFKNKQSLKQHVKTIHGNKALLCILCPKSFARKDYLVKHMESSEKKMLSHAKETYCDQ